MFKKRKTTNIKIGSNKLSQEQIKRIEWQGFTLDQEVIMGGGEIVEYRFIETLPSNYALGGLSIFMNGDNPMFTFYDYDNQEYIKPLELSTIERISRIIFEEGLK